MQQQSIAPMPLTPMVKRIIIINCIIWIFGVLILQKMILQNDILFTIFGMTPSKTLESFWVWQPITYMFIHSSGVFHVLVNMLILWMWGSELELRWGGRYFLKYYLFSGAGGAVLYVFFVYIYAWITGDALPTKSPVVGASGAIFGVMTAYGLVFGERPVLFMFMFPMKAKVLVLILGVIQLLMLLDSGPSSQVSNLSHLCGIAAGFLYLIFQSRIKPKMDESFKKKSKLRLVVDNEKKDNKPRYWN